MLGRPSIVLQQLLLPLLVLTPTAKLVRLEAPTAWQLHLPPEQSSISRNSSSYRSCSRSR